MARTTINKRSNKRISNRLQKIRNDKLNSLNRPIPWDKKKKQPIQEVGHIFHSADRGSVRPIPCNSNDVHLGHPKYQFCQDYKSKRNHYKEIIVNHGVIDPSFLAKNFPNKYSEINIKPIPKRPAKSNTTYYMSLDKKLEKRKQEIESWGDDLTPTQKMKKSFYKRAVSGRLNAVRNKKRRI